MDPQDMDFLAAELEDPRFQSGHMDFSPTGLSPDLLRTLPLDLTPSIGFFPLARPGLITVLLRIYHRFPQATNSLGHCMDTVDNFLHQTFALISAYYPVSADYRSRTKPHGTAPTRQLLAQRIVWAGLCSRIPFRSLNRAQALLFFMTPMTPKHGFDISDTSHDALDFHTRI